MRQPGFAAIVVLTLAIGIGVNTAIYTVVDATLLRVLPFHEPDRLMAVSLTRPDNPGSGQIELAVWSFPKYETFRKNQEIFENTALYRAITLNLSGEGEPERLRAEEVSASYFPTLGVAAKIGRTFLGEEDAIPERDLVAVVSRGLWERRFGADPAIVGKTIMLDLKNYTVVGILPPGFQGLSGPADIWVPVHRSPAADLNQAFAHAWQFVARRKPDTSIEQAKTATTLLGRVVDETHKSPTPGSGPWSAKTATLNDGRIDPMMRKSVLVLFGAVTCVLLIACVNVSNMLLARSTTRRREIAIRTAIGAGRGRVIRQLLTESMLLAFVGGAASLLVSYVSVSALNVINPAGNAFGFGPSALPASWRLSGLTLLALNSIHLDGRALLFTFVLATLTGMLFGLAPAWQAARTEVSDALKKSHDHASMLQLRGKAILVVAEIALAFILLTGAGLVIKSLARLTSTPIGINAENVLTLRLGIPPGTANPERTISFFEQLEERVSSQSGVVSAALGTCHALAGFCGSAIVRFPDRPAVPAGTEPTVGTLRVSPSYFDTMKVPLVRGRVFTKADRGDTPKVVVISETTARRFFPGEDPIGKPIGLGINGFGQRAEIVGIVGDVRHGQLDQPPGPDAYVSLLQAPLSNVYLFARTADNPSASIPAVRQQVADLNPDLPIYDVRTMADRVSNAAARARFVAILLGIFATIAVALAAIGIYGVMSYAVRQQTREIGIRVALGARSQDVVRHEIYRAAVLIFAGTVVGLASALAATQVLETSLYEVKPHDPQTYIVITVLLAGVALLASYVPARRATLVDPAITLRTE
jgi:putative ABC transport system permease protein